MDRLTFNYPIERKIRKINAKDAENPPTLFAAFALLLRLLRSTFKISKTLIHCNNLGDKHAH